VESAVLANWDIIVDLIKHKKIGSILIFGDKYLVTISIRASATFTRLYSPFA